MRWSIGVKGGDALAQRFGALARHPLLEAALQGAAAAVREGTRDGLGQADGLETARVEGGLALRAREDLLGPREFGTPDRPERPLLGPALRDARPGLAQAARTALRSGLRRARGRSR